MLAFEPATAEKQSGVDSMVRSYIAQQRRYLAYFVHSVREVGMDSAAIRQDIAHFQQQLGESVSLIDGGMDAHDARRYVEQQRGEDAGYEPDPESVEGMLHADRKKTASAILDRPEMAEQLKRPLAA